jgi:hypothetical protein
MGLTRQRNAVLAALEGRLFIRDLLRPEEVFSSLLALELPSRSTRAHDSRLGLLEGRGNTSVLLVEVRLGRGELLGGRGLGDGDLLEREPE